MSQADLAAAIGVSAATVGNFEQGRRSPEGDTSDRLAAALGCDREAIVGGDFVLVSRRGQIVIEAAEATE